MSAGIIQRSSSEFASPALLVNKKDGDKRLVVDFRALNKISEKQKFPLPLIEDLIDSVGNYKYFSTLDLAAGYHQIPVSSESVHKTAFITPEGLYEYLRVPFGLSNAPAVFQKMMTEMFEPLRQFGVVPYLDDIIIPSNTINEGLILLEKVFKIIEEFGLTIKLSKSKFLQQEIMYLGYLISKNNFSVSYDKVQAVNNFPTPRTVHQLRQFLGLVGYFRKFIPNYASKTTKLTALLKKECKWKWEQIHSNIVQELKNIISSKPVLSIFDPKLKTLLYTDACQDGIGGILMQVTKEGEKPIAYYSKQTTQVEQKYHSFELELLAAIKSVKTFRHYLLGLEFTIVTDCSAVKNAMSKQKIVPRIARWILSLQETNFKYNINRKAKCNTSMH